MNQKLIILLLFLFPSILFGQNKYKFKYRQHLTNQESTFTKETINSDLDSNKYNLTIQIFDKNGESVPFANISIKNNSIDTIIHSDLIGNVIAKLHSSPSTISVNAHSFTPLIIDNLVVYKNTKTTIKVLLGQLNSKRIAIIKSIRILKNEEITKLINDLSNNREVNELIKNKTCFITWEI